MFFSPSSSSPSLKRFHLPIKFPRFPASAPPTATPQSSQQLHWPPPATPQPVDSADGTGGSVNAPLGSRSTSRHTSFSSKQRPTLYANSLPQSNDVSFVGQKPGVVGSTATTNNAAPVPVLGVYESQPSSIPPSHPMTPSLHNKSDPAGIMMEVQARLAELSVGGEVDGGEVDYRQQQQQIPMQPPNTQLSEQERQNPQSQQFFFEDAAAPAPSAQHKVQKQHQPSQQSFTPHGSQQSFTPHGMQQPSQQPAAPSQQSFTPHGLQQSFTPHGSQQQAHINPPSSLIVENGGKAERRQSAPQATVAATIATANVSFVVASAVDGVACDVVSSSLHEPSHRHQLQQQQPLLQHQLQQQQNHQDPLDVGACLTFPAYHPPMANQQPGVITNPILNGSGFYEPPSTQRQLSDPLTQSQSKSQQQLTSQQQQQTPVVQGTHQKTSTVHSHSHQQSPPHPQIQPIQQKQHQSEQQPPQTKPDLLPSRSLPGNTVDTGVSHEELLKMKQQHEWLKQHYDLSDQQALALRQPPVLYSQELVKGVVSVPEGILPPGSQVMDSAGQIFNAVTIDTASMTASQQV